MQFYMISFIVVSGMIMVVFFVRDGERRLKKTE